MWKIKLVQAFRDGLRTIAYSYKKKVQQYQEFHAINDRDDHVKFLPNERAPVTVEKFQEVFIIVLIL